MTLPALATSTDLTADTNVQLARISGRIRRYCGWHIAPSLTVDSLILDADGGSRLFLPSKHVTAVTSVKIDGQLLDVDDYTWSTIGILRRSGCFRWPDAFRSVDIAFTHGYDTVPDDLIEVAVSAAKRLPAQQAAVKAEASDNISRTYGGDLAGGFSTFGWTYSEQVVLDSYRIGTRP